MINKAIVLLFAFFTCNVESMKDAQNMMKEQMQVGVGSSNYSMDDILSEEDATVRNCKIFDNCRACTFKELQVIEACQQTGFRLIKQCKTTPKEGSKTDIIAETYEDISCQEAATELTPLRNGELAPYKSGPFSLYWFFVIMSLLAYGMHNMLMQRRAKIINQVYSKLSIVKTKN